MLAYNPHRSVLFGYEEEIKMQAHQERVVVEKMELDKKITALAQFADGAIFSNLPLDEQERLNCQLTIMSNYSEVLGQRIYAFPVEFGEKGLGMNPDTGCISNEGLAERERKYGRPGMSEEDVQKIRDIDEKNFGQKIQFTPHMETLRDRFAIAAMASMTFTHNSGISSYGMENQVSMFVDGAYAIADAMMARREK